MQELIDHLAMALQSGKTENSLIGDFYNHVQKAIESEDISANDLQVLVCKIIIRKLEFRMLANEDLKHQHANHL